MLRDPPKVFPSNHVNLEPTLHETSIAMAVYRKHILKLLFPHVTVLEVFLLKPYPMNHVDKSCPCFVFQNSHWAVFFYPMKTWQNFGSKAGLTA